MSIKEKQVPDGAVAKPGSNDSEIKRQNSAIHKKRQCLVTVKLTRQIAGSNPTVTLERKDEHRTGFMIKKSKHVQELIKKKKRLKNYSAAQIFHAIRGAGTETGTLLFDAAGRAFTKMQE